MSSERWRPVVGFEELYEVSSLGRVRSVPRWVNTKGGAQRRVRSRIMRLNHSNKMGYPRVCLHRGAGKKTMALVHTLVLEAFVGPRPRGRIARHFPDRTPANVRADNLSWATYEENCRDRERDGTTFDNRGENHPNAKLSNKAVRRIRTLSSRGLRQRDIARLVGCSQSNVSLVLQGRAWANV